MAEPRSVRVGGRYADRDQVARFSTYNWGRLSEQWGNGGPAWSVQPARNTRCRSATTGPRSRRSVSRAVLTLAACPRPVGMAPTKAVWPHKTPWRFYKNNSESTA